MRNHALALLLLAAGCAPGAAADSPAFNSANAGDKADGNGPLSPTGPFAVKNALPIVLHHGFNASPDSEWGWNERVRTTLEQLGHRVFISQVNPYQSPLVRAPELEDFIAEVLKETGAKKVHLIAHSQGGLDARLLISPAGLDHADQVASVTTISTPHHGTYIADTAGGFVDLFSGDAAGAALQAGGSASGVLADIMAKQLNAKAKTYTFDLAAALGSMAESRIENEFNGVISDAPGVYAQSLAGVSNLWSIVNDQDVGACQVADADELVAGTLRRISSGTRDSMTFALHGVAAFVAHGLRLIPNDGVVRVDSAHWGRFRGCILADHMGEVGQGTDAGKADAKTGFDIYVMYAQLAAELVRDHQN
jgi:triacylglycerol lipase